MLVRVPGAALSHESALRAHGVALPEASDRQRITVPRNWSHVALDGWEVVRRDLLPHETVVLSDGLRATTLTRSLVDQVPELSLAQGVALADSLLREKLLTAAVLADVLTGRRGPSRARRRAVTGLVDPGAGSVLESLFRVLVHEAGLPAPRSQHQVVDGRRQVARVDFAWVAQRVVVEVDGFAFHSDREAYRRDRERMNELERLGWRVLRFTWADVVGRPEHVVALVRSLLAAAA